MEERKNNKWIPIIIFCAGLLLCTYPIIRSMIENKRVSGLLSTYSKQIEETSKDEQLESLKNAKEYNDALWQSNGILIQDYKDGILTDESYKKQLDLLGNNMMGIIEIPKINVNLPIYHGTDDDVLSVGVGHLRESSLPCGGKNSHAILTGHRGLPTSKLFTRLDEMEENDLFFVKIGDEKLAYQVSDIKIILPNDVEGLGIQPEKDLISLVTCTPYGINTKRLVVTGERIDYQLMDLSKEVKGSFSIREIVFNSLPVIFVVYGIVQVVRYIRRKSKGGA